MDDRLSSQPKRVSKDTRKPFGSTTQKLAYPPRSGFHRHWFNEEPGRIDSALGAGYTHVEDKEGKKVQRVVGVGAGGGPLNAFLMEIPEEWYEEDMKRQEKAVMEMDESIRRGTVASAPGDGRYVKAINIREGKGS